MELVVLTSQTLSLLTLSLSLSLSLSISLPFFPLSLSLSPHYSFSCLLCSLSISPIFTSMDTKSKAKKEPMTVDAEDDDIEDREDDSDSKKKKPTAAAVGASSASRKGSGGMSPPSCQAEKCTADLTDSKRYHRRHKVCELHAKAPFVIVSGLRQRFCQQCSRFHELSEFDEAKRSCRRRLAGHNERRRKNSTESHVEGPSRGSMGQENHCRQADQSGRTPIALPASPTYKHFQIR